MEDKKYPIYTIEARWNQDDYEGNSSSTDVMYQERKPVEFLLNEALEWWKSLVDRKEVSEKKRTIREKSPQLIELKISFKECEAWCLTWFQHWTFVDGQTDDELRASFGRFVQRRLPQHSRSEKGYCLMGAEDTWRWKEPCHCEACVARGVSYIKH